MSGFEVLSVVASIGSLIDLGVKVLGRVEDFRNSANGLPKAFRHIETRLPVSVEILRETKAAIDANRVSDTGRKALDPLINECHVQIETLNQLLSKMLPGGSDPGVVRTTFKAMWSVRYDEDVKKTMDVLEKHLDMLTHQAIAAARNQDVPSPKPSSPSFVNRPFHRDPDFVERAVLTEIISLTHRPNPLKRVALVGQGGVGKSQIAIEYAYRTRETSPDTWVFWVHAGSIAHLERGYRSIAEAVRIPRWDEKSMDVFKTVHDWLSDEANGKWVMILDNADDIDVFKAPPPRYNAHSETIAPSKTELRQFLPKSSTGSILITTVTTHVARELVDNANHYLNVELMNEDEALLLLERKLRGNHNTDEMRELIKTLEYLPIAISQAAAFISKSEPRETVAGYIAKAKSSDVTKLLEESIYESHRDADRSNSVVVSWQITFRYILRKRPSAARLLSLMCLFDRQQILDPFLIGLYGKKDSALIPVAVPPMNRLKKRLYDRDYKRRYEKESGRRAENEHEFGKDWQVLHDFLLIKTDAKGNSFSMHRLVQVTARRWLEHNEEMQHWTRRYMYIVDYVFKFTITIEGDTNTSFFWPHLRQLEDYQPDDNWELTTWVRMMKLAAEIGIHYDGAHAEVLSKAVFNVVKSTLGMENEMTLGYANIVVKALHHLHKFEEAEPLAREVFQKYVKILGPDHESTVGSMHNLASLLWSQGEANQEKEAEGCALMSRVAEARQGKDNVWVLMHLSETTYADMRGRYLMSEGRIRALYPVGNRVAGSWDSIAILLTTSLAANYMAQERFAESEELYRQALREQGKDGYMDVVQSLALASVFARQEKVEEAEDLYRRVSEYISKGDYWEDELVLKAELAAVLVKRGAFREAEELSHQVLQRTLHKVVPANHEPWVAMHTLAAIREQQGHYEEALARYNVAHAGMLVTQRDFYLDTKAYLKDYSALKSKLEGEEPSGQDSAPDYQDLSNESEAFYQMQALPKFEWKCGFEYGPTLATAIGSLAQTLSMRGCFQEANYTICLALEGLMGMLGPEHQDTLQCFRAWAEILVRQNMFGDALVAYKFWYAGLGKTLGEEHGDTQRALHSLTEVQEKIEAGSAPARDVGSLLSGEKTYFPGQWVD